MFDDLAAHPDCTGNWRFPHRLKRWRVREARDGAGLQEPNLPVGDRPLDVLRHVAEQLLDPKAERDYLPQEGFREQPFSTCVWFS
jgi:hypothetical protein